MFFAPIPGTWRPAWHRKRNRWLATFTYNALDQRIGRTAGGAAQNYVLNYALPLPSVAVVQSGRGRSALLCLAAGRNAALCHRRIQQRAALLPFRRIGLDKFPDGRYRLGYGHVRDHSLWGDGGTAGNDRQPVHVPGRARRDAGRLDEPLLHAGAVLRQHGGQVRIPQPNRVARPALHQPLSVRGRQPNRAQRSVRQGRRRLRQPRRFYGANVPLLWVWGGIPEAVQMAWHAASAAEAGHARGHARSAEPCASLRAWRRRLQSTGPCSPCSAGSRACANAHTGASAHASAYAHASAHASAHTPRSASASRWGWEHAL